MFGRELSRSHLLRLISVDSLRSVALVGEGAREAIAAFLRLYEADHSTAVVEVLEVSAQTRVLAIVIHNLRCRQRRQELSVTGNLRR